MRLCPAKSMDTLGRRALFVFVKRKVEWVLDEKVQDRKNVGEVLQ